MNTTQNLRSFVVVSTVTGAVGGMLWGAVTSYFGLSTALPVAMLLGAIFGAGVAAVAGALFSALVKLANLTLSPWSLVGFGVVAVLMYFTFTWSLFGVNTTSLQLIASLGFGALICAAAVAVNKWVTGLTIAS